LDDNVKGLVKTKKAGLHLYTKYHETVMLLKFSSIDDLTKSLDRWCINDRLLIDSHVMGHNVYAVYQIITSCDKKLLRKLLRKLVPHLLAARLSAPDIHHTITGLHLCNPANYMLKKCYLKECEQFFMTRIKVVKTLHVKRWFSKSPIHVVITKNLLKNRIIHHKTKNIFFYLLSKWHYNEKNDL
jgi:hypothetical protein